MATLLAVLGLIALGQGCYKETFITRAGTGVTFSVDTLGFDTVFTSVGSATRQFKIYNPHAQTIKLSRLYLEQGDASFFRINVDGTTYPAGEAREVEILAKDSIYVFVEVTVDPDQPVSISPFVITELLKAEVNGTTSTVVLEAWGQNANYVPSLGAGGQLALLSCDLQDLVWNDPRPYVIYGLLLIDSCTLRVQAGTRIHLHGGIVKNDLGVYNDGIIWTLPAGRLVLEGTADRPIIIEGDRLEKTFANVQGQWAGIRLGAGSKGHSMTHTIIRNALVGVRVDSAATLSLQNSRITNTAGVGLLAVHATVRAENCLFYGQGSAAFLGSFGGNYTLDYCTLASFGNRAEAMYLDNYQCIDEDCSSVRLFTLRFTARNSIFAGSSADELTFVDATEGKEPAAFVYAMTNNVVRVDELLDDFPDFPAKCKDCVLLKGNEKLFKSVDLLDFRLDSLSVAANKGIPLSQITQDIEGKVRNATQPDPGCFEQEH